MNLSINIWLYQGAMPYQLALAFVPCVVPRHSVETTLPNGFWSTKYKESLSIVNQKTES